MNTIPDFLISGIQASDSSESNLLYIDAASLEVCWKGKGGFSLPIKSLVSVTGLGQSSLSINTREASFKFRLSSEEERERTLEAFNSFLNKENEPSTSKKPPNQQILDSVADVLALHSGQSTTNYEELPKKLEELMQKYSSSVWEVENEIDRQGGEERTLQNKLNMLRKKMRMLELDNPSPGVLSQIQNDISREKEHSDFLQDKIKQVTQEKEALEAEARALKDQLEQTTSKNSLLQKEVFTQGVMNTLTSDPHYDILQKGFYAYVCLFVSNHDLVPSLNLTPRRAYEDGVYKKRHVSLSTDLSQLVWKAISLFSKKKASIDLGEVTAILDGTEDPRRYEPFACNKYITILGKGLSMILSVDKAYYCYLEAIKMRFQEVHKLAPVRCDVHPSKIWQMAAEQLNSQSLLINKIMNRYKTALIDSICYVDQGNAHLQDTYLKEIQVLRKLNEDLPQGLFSSDPESYLREERAILLKRKAVLESLIKQK